MDEPHLRAAGGGVLSDEPLQQPLRVVRLVEGERARATSRCDEIAAVAESLAELGTRVVLFSGGEPLLRPEVFEIAALFRAHGIDAAPAHERRAARALRAQRVAEAFARVIVSLDSPDESGYRAIRGVAALPTLERGVAQLRAHRTRHAGRRRARRCTG